MTGTFSDAAEFIGKLTFDDLPDAVVAFARRCVLDLVGVAAGATVTDLSRTIANHAAEHFGAGTSPTGEPRAARLLFDGRIVSPVGAALAAGMSIDSLDAHDGHKITKGHSGCSTLATALAFADSARAVPSDQEFLTNIVLGYELSTRAGVALHQSVPDYHTSGAWGAVSSAAIGARCLNLDPDQTRHALGIAEYHGPRSQMMRVIDHPTMLKDGSGWGAMAGVSAAHLAAQGFTGAPAITVEAPELADLWDDLGGRWRIFEQYFKPLPVCRWAQPAVEAALELRRLHGIDGADVVDIEVVTFHEARRLATSAARTTEEAQYSLPFPVAAAVSRGQVGPVEVSGDAFTDPEITRLAAAIRITESDAYNEAFPGNRFAHVIITLQSGESFRSEPTEPRGDPEAPLTDAEIRAKFHHLADPILGAARATAIEDTIDHLGAGGDVANVATLFDLILTDV